MFDINNATVDIRDIVRIGSGIAIITMSATCCCGGSDCWRRRGYGASGRSRCIMKVYRITNATCIKWWFVNASFNHLCTIGYIYQPFGVHFSFNDGHYYQRQLLE
jgi:hypothetical protein